MKKIILTVAITIMACTSAFAQFMNTGTTTPAQQGMRAPQQNYGVSEKSPAVAGLLSFVLPGAGQFYNGENSKGWSDLAWQVGGYLATSIGTGIVAGASSDAGIILGAILMIGGAATCGYNGVASIIDAVRSAKRINLENGYAVVDLSDDISLGFAPEMAYNHPEYSIGMKNEFNAGLKMSISF